MHKIQNIIKNTLSFKGELNSHDYLNQITIVIIISFLISTLINHYLKINFDPKSFVIFPDFIILLSYLIIWNWVFATTVVKRLRNLRYSTLYIFGFYFLTILRIIPGILGTIIFDVLFYGSLYALSVNKKEKIISKN